MLWVAVVLLIVNIVFEDSCIIPCCSLAVAAMVAKGVKLTPTGYEYPTDYTGPHLPDPSSLPADDSAALSMIAYGGYDDSGAAAAAAVAGWSHDASGAGGPADYAAYYAGGYGGYDYSSAATATATATATAAAETAPGDDRGVVGKGGRSGDGGEAESEAGPTKRAKTD